MNYYKKTLIEHDYEKVWAVVSSQSFQESLLQRISPVELGLSSSFYVGKPHNGQILVRGKSYGYTAVLNKNELKKSIKISIYTDSVDGLIEIKVMKNGETASNVSIDIDVDASGMLGLFLGSSKRYIEQRVLQAIQLLQSRLD